ncbi:2OG-Fe(II) oxygenase [Chitinimonas koreensis]|uniref:2OG-Fe(II) oxygenase n=1 Tax=Chitinimonas koreensis TaxID=356302 RepID=UPI0004164149|nr:2OG-Fe(II) oxygenase [Chitinimonas koreensis]QNM96924.1 2OG-Fe(II) oxygenase [Chitinimonas koreensis]
MNEYEDFLRGLPALIDGLATHGHVVCDDFLSPAQTAALRDEGAQRLAGGEFHRAGVGRAEQQAVRDEIRGDSVRWLDPQRRAPAEQAYWQRIEALQAALNRELFLGIREGEFHYAHYPVGGFYKRHLDRFRDDDARVVSVVCYLNEGWQDADGGQLRLWLEAGEDAPQLDIAPRGGRLVLFMADRFWHAVLPATQPRWSVTGWLRRAG